ARGLDHRLQVWEHLVDALGRETQPPDDCHCCLHGIPSLDRLQNMMQYARSSGARGIFWDSPVLRAPGPCHARGPIAIAFRGVRHSNWTGRSSAASIPPVTGDDSMMTSAATCAAQAPDSGSSLAMTFNPARFDLVAV